MTQLQYWVALSLALGPTKFRDGYFEYIPDIQSLFQASPGELSSLTCLTSPQIKGIKHPDYDRVDRIIKQCEQNGWQIITYDDPLYPPLLHKIQNPPAVLYVHGNAQTVAKGMCIGVVGTRKAGLQSIKFATQISKDLAQEGVVVVSGGALGVDTAAHEGALRGGGTTVAVLGCGLGERYLMENDSLRRRIAATGALMTEYPPFTPATRFSFPVRNRIISGMSEGILVVEAGEKSGSIITAKSAIDQGRDVFAVPGDVFNSSFCGTNTLIRNGAKLVITSEDIMEEYRDFCEKEIQYGVTHKPGTAQGQKLSVKEPAPENDSFRKSAPKKSKGKAHPLLGKEKENEPRQLEFFSIKNPAEMTSEEKNRAVYLAFRDDALYPSEVAQITGLPLGDVTLALTLLEMEDLVQCLPGGRYQTAEN